MIAALLGAGFLGWTVGVYTALIYLRGACSRCQLADAAKYYMGQARYRRWARRKPRSYDVDPRLYSRDSTLEPGDKEWMNAPLGPYDEDPGPVPRS